MYLSILQACFHLRGWGVGCGGGGGHLVVILVRVCDPFFLKTTPIIYLAFEKYDLFIYFIVHNVDIFICYPLILYSSA